MISKSLVGLLLASATLAASIGAAKKANAHIVVSGWLDVDEIRVFFHTPIPFMRADTVASSDFQQTGTVSLSNPDCYIGATSVCEGDTFVYYPSTSYVPVPAGYLGIAETPPCGSGYELIAGTGGIDHD